MKNKYIISLLIINLLVVLLSQGQNACENGISTNPDNPTNSLMPNFFNEEDNFVWNDHSFYLNSFDWINRDGTFGNYAQYDLHNMEYAGQPLLEMENIMSESTPFYQYIWDGDDHFPENGWELMLVNLGYFPNGEEIPGNGNFGNSMPYIVLYNKYSGILRIFIKFGLDVSLPDAPNSYRVSLRFVNSSMVSGLQRLNEGADQALDKETDIVRMSSVVEAPLEGQQWASADFRLAYDPCTCFYPSRLVVEVSQIDIANITLVGRELTLENQDLLDSENNINGNATGFLSGFEYNEQGGLVTGGISIYKTMEEAVDTYITDLTKYKIELEQANQHNERVEKNLKILKGAKYVLSFIFLNGKVEDKVDAIGSEGLSVWDNLMLLNQGYTIIEGGVKKINANPLLKLAKNIISESGNTWISENFEKKKLPSKPDMPSVSYTEARYVGTIDSEASIGNSILFYTPGTYGTEATKEPSPIAPDNLINPTLDNFSNYPVYNEVLGVFALLETPKIHLYESDFENIQTVDAFDTRPIGNVPWTEVLDRHRFDKRYRMKLGEELKYATNSLLDIENVEIKVALAANASAEISDINSNHMTTSTLSSYLIPSYTINFESNNLDLEQPNAPIVAAREFGEFDGQWPDLISTSDVESYLFNQDVSLVTPFVPIDAFFSLESGIGIRNEIYNRQIFSPTSFSFGLNFDIELLLQVDITFASFNENGEQNSSTMLLKYKIPAENILLQEGFPEDEINPFGEYPELSYFSDTEFDGSIIENCQLEGNLYQCISRDKIIIDGIIEVTSPYSVEFIAENEIEVISESNLPSEVLLTLQPVHDYSHPMPQSTLSEVVSFCEGNNGNAPVYQANISTRASETSSSSSEYSSEEELEEENQDSDIDLKLFPNPTSGRTTVSLTNAQKAFVGEIGLLVTDLSGKKVFLESYLNSESEISLDVSQLQSGMYFIRVYINEVLYTEKLIVK